MTRRRLDDEPDPFHVAVREGFLRLAAAHPDRMVVVDASGGSDEVFDRVRTVVNGALT